MSDGGGLLEPVVLRFERDHEFDGSAARGARCRVCRRGRYWVAHHGYPEPLDTDSGTDPLKWQKQKRMWQEVFGEALHASGLPRGVVESVQIAVRYTFPTRTRRDRDNLVYPLCKFLGDTLVRGRYTEVPYSAVDWSDAGMVDGRKLHRRVVDPRVAEKHGPTVRLVGRTFKRGEPVPVMDPEGGWLADDRWDRFQVIEMDAVYEPGRAALEVMVMPSATPPGPWPPAVGEAPVTAELTLL